MLLGKVRIYLMGAILVAIGIYLVKLEFQIMSLKAKVGVLLDNNKNLEIKNTLLQSNNLTLNEAINKQNNELERLEEQATKANKDFEEWNKLPDEIKYGNLAEILQDQKGKTTCANVVRKLDKIKNLRMSDL